MTKDKHLEIFIEEYCEKVDITIHQLRSKYRRRDLVEKRMVIATILRDKVGLTLSDIGYQLSRDHASIIYYVKMTKRFIDVYPHVREIYDLCMKLYDDNKEYLFLSYVLPKTSGKTRFINNLYTEGEKKLIQILLEKNNNLKKTIIKLEKKIHDNKSNKA
tara:strand:- start:2067 stop:2546 length:480 start_codon:yes stop_codon:yes gene_type:complete